MSCDSPRVVLGVSGGIAAYKAVELLRQLQQRLGCDVRVVMTRAATRFVGPLTFEALSRHPVMVDVLAMDPEAAHGDSGIAHVRGAQADLIVVAPATADFLSRAATGRADDALGAVLLASVAPLVIAPAMESHMWQHPATQANVAILRRRGARIVEPGTGDLASGAHGVGRLAELDAIVEAVSGRLRQARALGGRHIVVTAGPTREPIDPVRFISNRSSGRMGCQLAHQARQRGARVTLVHGPLTVPLPGDVATLAVETALEMRAATVQVATGADALIMCAAVADYRVAEPASHKLSKQDAALDRIELVKNPDILAELGRSRPAPVIVGFAAETQDVESRGRAKLARKGVDALLANRVGDSSSGFDGDQLDAVLLFADGRGQDLGTCSKAEVAGHLLDAVGDLLASASPVRKGDPS